MTRMPFLIHMPKYLATDQAHRTSNSAAKNQSNIGFFDSSRDTLGRSAGKAGKKMGRKVAQTSSLLIRKAGWQAVTFKLSHPPILQNQRNLSDLFSRERS
jgi:hypothetical protein